MTELGRLRPATSPRPILPATPASPAFQPLTFQEADARLRQLLHQAPHEELRAKELGGDKGAVLGKADLVGGEFAPLCEEAKQPYHGAQDLRAPSTNAAITASHQGSLVTKWLSLIAGTLGMRPKAPAPIPKPE